MTIHMDDAGASGPGESALAHRRLIDGDLVFRSVAGAATLLAVALISVMALDSIEAAWPAFQRFGLDFVTGMRWSPSFTVYGAMPFIYGTLLTSAIALLIAVPIAVLIALLVTEFLPPRIGRPVAIVVDLLAAVPSVVWGLWGLLVLVPFMRPIEHGLADGPGQFGGSSESGNSGSRSSTRR